MTRKIRSIILFTLLITFIYTNSLYALNPATHKAINVAISEGTYNGFTLDLYLKSNLGLISGIREILTENNSVQRWLELGGEYEDWPSFTIPFRRSVNHFHNPLTDLGYSGIWGTGVLDGVSSIRWALSPLYMQNLGGFYSWHDVKNYYYLALTSADRDVRSYNFAETFRGLGQLMHLIQDVSVPEHTRDDGHPFGGYESWVGKNPLVVISSAAKPTFFGGSIQSIAVLFDTNQYNLVTGPNATKVPNIGLAEYTGANFLSWDTMFTMKFPYPSILSVQKWTDQSVNRQYLRKSGEGVPVDHLAVTSFLYSYRQQYFPQYNEFLPVGMDSKVYEDYAKELLPRAVGYSAGLLNYFFRGTLEITAPDTYVYSIIDGSVNPQQFTKIKAKVMNTTPNEQIQNGVLQAVAKYKKRTDYQPDLSTDPPTQTSREPEFSYSVSAPITITSLDSINPQEFTFNFENSPIPAGITDLYLIVVFKGTLGNEVDNAIAAGMKDIIEPTHHVFWNLTDMVILYYQEANDPAPRYHLYTEEQIRSRPELESIVRQNNIWAAYLRPHDMTIRIAYLSNPPDPNNFIHINPIAEAVLPGGRHMRLIILLDREDNNYMRVTSFDSVYDNDQGSFLPSGCVRTAELVGAGEDRYNGQYMGLYCDSIFSSAGYHERDGVFRYQEASIFRTFKQHLRSLGKLWISPLPSPDDRYYPDEESIPADTTPYQATINFE